MPQRAVIYTRISEIDARQDKVRDQEAECRALADKFGYTVEAVFTDDGITAMRDKAGKLKVRIGFDALIDAITGGDVDVVIATEEARFDRDGVAKRTLEFASSEAGTVWHTVRDGQVDPGTDAGELMSGIRVLLDRQEVRRKSDRQKARNVARVSEGTPLSGKRRFGFESNNMDPNESEAVHVRWAYDQILGGATIYSVMRALNDAEVKGSYGYVWDATRVRRMLQSERNAGILLHNGLRSAASRITPLVPEETWAQACAVLAQESRVSKPGPIVRKGLLTGIAHCGVCDAPMRTAANNQRGKHIELYKCSTKTEGRGHGTPHASIRRHLLDRQVARDVFFWVVEHSEELASSASPRIGTLSVELAEARAQRARAQEIGMMPGADLALTRSALAGYGTNIAALEQAIDHERASSVRSSVVEYVRSGWWDNTELPGAQQREELQKNESMWFSFWDALDLERRRELIRTLFRVTVNRGTGDERIDVLWLR